MLSCAQVNEIQYNNFTFLSVKDDNGPEDNSESETVSIKNIQFLTEAENTGLTILHMTVYVK